MYEVIEKYTVFKPLVTKSGAVLPYYCNLREVSSDAKDFVHCVSEVSAIISQSFPQAQGVVCVPYGAVLLSGGLAYKSKLPSMVYRKEVKNYGAGGDKVGVLPKGAKVVIIEDTITTGGSIIEVVEKVQADGYEVIGVVALYTHEITQAQELFDTHNILVKTVCSRKDFISYLHSSKRITFTEMVEYNSAFDRI